MSLEERVEVLEQALRELTENTFTLAQAVLEADQKSYPYQARRGLKTAALIARGLIVEIEEVDK